MVIDEARRWWRHAVWTVPLIVGAGFLSGRVSNSGYGNPWFDALHKPFFMPPGTSKEQVAVMRKAFMDTMKDKDFLADGKKAHLEVDPLSGEEMQKRIIEAYQAPKKLITRMSELMGRQTKG